MRKKYTFPPINEVVAGVYFNEPLQNLRAEHIGLLWSDFVEEFPVSDQAPPIGNVGVFGPSPDIFPLPRFWFISKDDARLIQVQKNAFLFNWRKRQEVYPHYEPIIAEFRERYSGFKDALKRVIGVEQIGIGSAELAYINTIEDEEYFRTFADAASILPSIALPIKTLADIQAFNTNFGFSVGSSHNLHININKSKNRQTQNDVLYFEIKVSGVPEETDSDTALLKWFDEAHNFIGEVFNEITSESIQKKYWIVEE